MIDYVVEKYGKNQVAQIITYGTMAAKKKGLVDWGSVGTRDRSKSNRSRWQSWNEDQEILNSRNYDSRFNDDVQEYGIAPTINYSDIPFNNYQDDVHQLISGYYRR